MTIRIRGNSFQVDVVVHSRISPTSERLRVRASFPSYRIAKRMEVIIRASLIRYGRWERGPSDYLHQPCPPHPNWDAERRLSRQRADLLIRWKPSSSQPN